MLGVSHATSGAAAGLWLAAAAPSALHVSGPRDAYAFATVCAGFAMLPDLDHPSSTATRRFGWATLAACYLVRPASALAFRLTKKPGEHGAGTHRGLTHTWLFAALTGCAIGAAADRWGHPAVWAVVFVGAALIVKGMDSLIPGPPSLGAAGVLTVLLAGTPTGAAWASGLGAPTLGVAAALGMAIHTVGDGLTESGAPILAPLTIGGKRWTPLGPPKLLRFHTGGGVEVVILFLLSVGTVLLAVAALPGGARLLVSVWDQLHRG